MGDVCVCVCVCGGSCDVCMCMYALPGPTNWKSHADTITKMDIHAYKYTYIMDAKRIYTVTVA